MAAAVVAPIARPSPWTVDPLPDERSNEAVLQIARAKLSSRNYLIASFPHLKQVSAGHHREGEEVASEVEGDPDEIVTADFLRDNVLVHKNALAHPNRTAYQVETAQGTIYFPRVQRLADTSKLILIGRKRFENYDSPTVFSIEAQPV